VSYYKHDCTNYNCKITWTGRKYQAEVTFKAEVIAEEETYWVCNGYDKKKSYTFGRFSDVLRLVKSIHDKTLKP